MMHSRGDSQTMQDPENTSYLDLEADIARELSTSAASAMASGVCAWNIILDPGIGFAKTAQQSAQLLRNLPGLRQHLEGMHLLSSQ
jgi:2-amino-4-hydroxy-6-hydroxymethyldihydropteridine diphosphokinase / dihydropteroate synthase